MRKQATVLVLHFINSMTNHGAPKEEWHSLTRHYAPPSPRGRGRKCAVLTPPSPLGRGVGGEGAAQQMRMIRNRSYEIRDLVTYLVILLSASTAAGQRPELQDVTR